MKWECWIRGIIEYIDRRRSSSLSRQKQTLVTNFLYMHITCTCYSGKAPASELDQWTYSLCFWSICIMPKSKIAMYLFYIIDENDMLYESLTDLTRTWCCRKHSFTEVINVSQYPNPYMFSTVFRTLAKIHVHAIWKHACIYTYWHVASNN